jgi:hypothetical protein
MVFFAVILVTLALVMSQLLRDYYLLNTSVPLETRQEVFKYFGTFGRSMLSVFEITLGNWVPVCRLLTEDVSEWFILGGICHKLVIGFALVGVINGVFVQETFKSAADDDTLMMRRKLKAQQLHESKMRRFFYQATKATGNCDGQDENAAITWEMFENVMSHPTMQTWLSSMELEARDLKVMFNLLDDFTGEHDESITLPELIAGSAQLKGTARSIDVAILLQEVRQIKEALGLAAKGDNGEKSDRLINYSRQGSRIRDDSRGAL